MKRVLVTGGSGFIGRQVWNPLRSRGFEIHATGRHPLADNPPGVVFHPVDLFDRASHQALLERVKPDHLLHLAWYAEPGQYWDAPQNLAWLAATQSLVGAFCAAGGRRVVGAGSCAEYDWSDGLLIEGHTAEQPESQYGKAKLAAGQCAAAIVSAAGGSAPGGASSPPMVPQSRPRDSFPT